MSHVDEGALHAYLDGALDEFPQAEAERIRAHLDACAECAERLGEERRIRSDAHAMLDLAAPAVEAPGLEELRAYVERTRPRKSRISRMQRLGWAASVVLALGAGWMIREGQLQTRALDVRGAALHGDVMTTEGADEIRGPVWRRGRRRRPGRPGRGGPPPEAKCRSERPKRPSRRRASRSRSPRARRR